MNIHRIAAVSWRHLAFLFHPSCLIDIFFWTSFDVVLFGFSAAQFARAVPDDQYMACAFVVGVLAYRCLSLGIGSFMSNSLLRELADRNLLALYASPLRPSEWLMSGFFVGCVAAFVRLFLTVLAMVCVLNVCMQIPVWLIFIGVFYLIVFGCAVGLLMVSIGLFLGRAVQNWFWMMSQVFFLLSGVLCPLNLLPAWLRILSQGLPMPYFFDGLRNVFLGQPVWPSLLMGGALNLLYLVCAGALVYCAFNICKQRGFAQLEQS